MSTSINSIISERFIKRLQGVQKGKNSSPLKSVSIPQTLQFGARAFLTSVQRISGGIGVLNVVEDKLEKLKSLNDSMSNFAELAKKRIDQGAGSVVSLNKRFLELKKKFLDIVAESENSEVKILSRDGLAESLREIGLDEETSPEVKKLLDGFMTAGTEKNISGEEQKLAGKGAIFSLSSREVSLQSISAIERTQLRLDAIEKTLSNNLESLGTLRQYLANSLELARQAGLVFFENSERLNKSSDELTVKELAKQLSSEIRSNASQALNAVSELEPLIVAALTAQTKAEEKA
jgi:hypothetical protein